MALTLHRTLKPLSWLSHKVSAAFWLQSGACAVVAWSVLHGGITLPPASPTAGDAGTGPMAAALGPTRAEGASPPPSSLQLAAAPGLAEAQLALSTIDVIVTRNDTLDRIFR